METQAVVETGTRQGVPIRLLRVVTDGLDDDLTPLFGRDAAFSPLRLFLRLLWPAAWPLALRLRRNSRLARHRLVSALSDFVKASLHS
jgi:hypothetical protein